MPSPFAQLPDEALVAQMALGDEPALAELYDRFGSVAYRLAVRVLRDRALAEDAVQDAFLGAWRTAAAFDSARGTVSTWLMTLVHRRAVDLVRREEPGGKRTSSTSTPIASHETTDEEAAVREGAAPRAVRARPAALRPA